jgi:hypothetical protein
MNSITEQERLIAQLCELTKRWTTYEDIPRSQQTECRSIGGQLDKLGGKALMIEAYYEAKAVNTAAFMIQAYWDGIGDWQW